MEEWATCLKRLDIIEIDQILGFVTFEHHCTLLLVVHDVQDHCWVVLKGEGEQRRHGLCRQQEMQPYFVVLMIPSEHLIAVLEFEYLFLKPIGRSVRLGR